MKLITKEGEVQELSMWNIPTDLGTVSMSSFQGDMDISYKNIVKVFGKETLNGDYKVQAEWHVITPDGFATIYDYKQGVKYNGRHDGIPKSKVRDWHIGGETDKVVPWIYKALNLK